MTLNPERRQQVARAAALLNLLPDEMWVEVHDGELYFQGITQENVKLLRSLFPGALWNKKYNEGTEWWEYTAKYAGVPIRIYAVSEAPPACTAIEEEYVVEEEVPTAFELRKVVKKRLRWDCSKAVSA